MMLNARGTDAKAINCGKGKTARSGKVDSPRGHLGSKRLLPSYGAAAQVALVSAK